MDLKVVHYVLCKVFRRDDVDKNPDICESILIIVWGILAAIVTCLVMTSNLSLIVFDSLCRNHRTYRNATYCTS
jgi:hypothetical protein